VTEEELDQFFSKAGMIRYDAQSGGKKIKIYKEDGKCLGDGIISFQKQESVAIALDMLNDGYLRQDC